MKNQAPPPRLRYGAEFGDLLRQLSSESISSERLAENAQAIKSRLMQPTSTGPTPATTGGAGKLLGKMGITALVAASLGLGYRALSTRHGHSAGLPAPAVELPAVTTPSVAPSPVSAENAAAPATENTTRVTERAHRRIAVRESTKIVTQTSAHAEHAPVQPAPAEQAPVQPIAVNQLSEQLRDFEAAKQAAHARHYDAALERLDELVARFPDTPLAAEVEMARAEYLAKSGQLEEATRLVQTLANSPRHVGKRAELLRVLADLWIKRQKCEQAGAALVEAERAGLPTEEATTVRRGLEKCRQ